MVPHCGFDLHFSNNEWCWASFHVFVSRMSSLEKCLFNSFVHFLIGSFIFLELSCVSCLYIFEINYLSVASFANIFSHSEGCLFTLLIVLCCAKTFTFNWVPFVYFCFYVHYSGRWLIEDPAVIYVRVFCLYFLLGVLQFLVLYLDL